MGGWLGLNPEVNPRGTLGPWKKLQTGHWSPQKLLELGSQAALETLSRRDVSHAYTEYCQRSKVSGASHPTEEPAQCKDDTCLKLMRSIN